MKLFHTGNISSFVNIFADFILTNFNPNENLSQIQVTDCSNFIVIGGKTESSELLDLYQVKSKFAESYQMYFDNIDIIKINIIDLIQYQTKPDIIDNQTFGYFYNSKRPIYHTDQINLISSTHFYSEYEDNLKLYSKEFLQFNNSELYGVGLHISSEFPYGYSIKNNRDKLYYSEYVSYNLFTLFGINKIKINWFNEEKRLISDSFIDNEYINSMMLDVFDFNLNKFNDKVKEYSIMDDILSPFLEKPWLVKDKTGELFIT
jgi:hypothetical protein